MVEISPQPDDFNAGEIDEYTSDPAIDREVLSFAETITALSPKSRAEFWQRTRCPIAKVTVFTNTKGDATKVFTLTASGELRNKSAAQIYEGLHLQREFRGLYGFIELIKTLERNQANTYGLAGREGGPVVTQWHLKNGAADGAIARDEDHLAFAEGKPGIWMSDHDPRKPDFGKFDQFPPLSCETLDDLICGVMPEIAGVARVWKPSSSAYIYRTSDGKELIGSGGWRLYIVVDDASQIPALGHTLYQRLWEAGHGWIWLSKSGSRLDRSIVDATVWQASRLDFAAFPVMGEGLEKRHVEPVFLPGSRMLKTAGLADGLPMAQWRQQCDVLQKALRAKKRQADKVTNQYAEERVEELASKNIHVDKAVFVRAVREKSWLGR